MQIFFNSTVVDTVLSTSVDSSLVGLTSVSKGSSVLFFIFTMQVSNSPKKSAVQANWPQYLAKTSDALVAEQLPGTCSISDTFNICKNHTDNVQRTKIEY